MLTMVERVQPRGRKGDLSVLLSELLKYGKQHEQYSRSKDQPSEDTSTYLHWDVGYGPLAQRALDAFITPECQGLINMTVRVWLDLD